MERWQDQIYDLGQNPQTMLVKSTGERLPTTISGSGLLFAPFVQRWLIIKEVFASMGWPIYAGQAAAAYGTKAQFSRDSAAPVSRTLANSGKLSQWLAVAQP
eukprot:15458006-Alexandrium_andersonii.AAC.1